MFSVDYNSLLSGDYRTLSEGLAQAGFYPGSIPDNLVNFLLTCRKNESLTVGTTVFTCSEIKKPFLSDNWRKIITWSQSTLKAS